MERADSIHVSVGGIFLGVGGVGLSISIPLAAAVKPHEWTALWFLIPTGIAGAMGLVGLYIVAAVYRGWWLPQTATERTFAPALRVVGAQVTRFVDDSIVFQLSFVNEGRGDVADALVNVVAPAFLTRIRRCAEDGSLGHHEGAWSTTSESLTTDDQGNPVPSIYWNGNISFPGRLARITYFRSDIPEGLPDFPIRVSVTAEVLDTPLRVTLDLSISGAEESWVG